MASVLGFSVVPYGSPLVGTFLVPGSTLKASVRKEVAALMVGFAADFNKYVEPLNPKTSGCHNPRKIAGSDSWSRHAPGIAWDFNWHKHEMGKQGTFTAAQVVEIRKLLKKWSYKGMTLLRWGGDYKGRKDEMHFELNVDRVIALSAVAALQRDPQGPVSTPKRRRGTRTLMLGMSGEDVSYVQRYIGPKHCGKDDGKFGHKTLAGVKWYQANQGLRADGIVGRRTWQKLDTKVRY